jgi:uncharacterized protein YegP (UPF0339 family)
MHQGVARAEGAARSLHTGGDMNSMNFLRTSLLTLALSLTACGVETTAQISETDVELMDAESELAATTGRFETFTGKDGKFYFHLLAGNGEKILASQGYTTLASAVSGIESVRNNATNPNRFLSREAVDGSKYFVLVAGNGRIIGVSEMYASAANAARGQATVQGVMKNIISSGQALLGDDRFETFRGIDGKYYFHLKANNGQIVLASQGYTTKTGATNGINSVKTNGTIGTRYQVRAAADGQHYFVLKAGNGAVIGRSELYVSVANAERGIAVVQGLLPVAK